jgi:hypothetical protein
MLQNVLPTKSCVIWWLKHLNAPTESWVQTRVTLVHEFVQWCKEAKGGYVPTYHLIT